MPAQDKKDRQVLQIRLPHAGPVVDLHYSPDSRYLATASWDHTAKVWDVQTGKLVHEFRHQYWVEEICFTPDGKKLITATGNVQPQVRIYWLQTEPMIYTRIALPKAAGSVACSQDGHVVITRDVDTGISAWDVIQKKRLWGPVVRPISHTIEWGSSPLVVSHVHNWVAFYLMKSIQVRELLTGKLVKQIPLARDTFVKLAFTPNGSHLVFASGSDMYIYSLPDFKLVAEPFRHPVPVRTLGVSKQRDRIATGTWGPECAIRVFRLGQGSLTLEHCIRLTDGKRTADSSVEWLDFSPDGTKLLSVDSVEYGAPCFVRVWDLKNASLILGPYQSRDIIDKAIFSPDGKTFAVAFSEEKEARLYKPTDW